MSESANLNELAAAMCKVQADIESAKKDSTNPHLKSKYADLTSVWEVCKEVLPKNGLCVIQTLFHHEDGVGVRTRLLHSTGQFIEGEVVVPVDKGTAQAMGSAITYGRRYSLAAIVGVTADDDDGDAATKAPPQRRPPFQADVANFQKPNPDLEKAKASAQKAVGFTPMSDSELVCVAISEATSMSELEGIIPKITAKKLNNDKDVRAAYDMKVKELKNVAG